MTELLLNFYVPNTVQNGLQGPQSYELVTLLSQFFYLGKLSFKV